MCRSTASFTVHQSVAEVWDYYLEQRRAAGRKHPPKLTDRRKRQIAARLMTFGKPSILRAVRILWKLPYLTNAPEDVFGSDLKVGVLLNQPDPPDPSQEMQGASNEVMLDRVLDDLGIETRVPARRVVGNAVFEADDGGVRLTVSWRFEDEASLRKHLELLGETIGAKR
jgi:hypothetical protein